jgi:SAM-dependent methyltransferase
LLPAISDSYYKLYRARLRAEWWLRDRFETKPAGFAIPPARLRFRVGEASDAQTFLNVGERTAADLEAAFRTADVTLGGSQTVLDFGCGCGRTLTWLAKKHPEVTWHGCDVDSEAIAWCRENLRGLTFSVNKPVPPLDVPPSTYDVLFGVSVFTHLSAEFQGLWRREFHRVLKPGGALLMSIYGKHVWRAMPQAAEVEKKGFLFCPSAKLQGIQPDWYHTALQTRAWITDRLREDFAEVNYLPRALGDHDAVVAASASEKQPAKRSAAAAFLPVLMAPSHPLPATFTLAVDRESAA